jgi:hypothetical protein
MACHGVRFLFVVDPAKICKMDRPEKINLQRNKSLREILLFSGPTCTAYKSRVFNADFLNSALGPTRGSKFR